MNWCFWTMVLEKTLQSPWTARRSNQSILKEINPGCSLEEWCWSWNSNTLATLREELTHWKRPWCWERLRAGREGDDRGWDGWMASATQWTWVWVNSGSWWWTGRPGVLRFMGSQSCTWLSELNWTERIGGGWGNEEQELTERDFSVNDNVLELDSSDGYTNLWIHSPPLNCAF